MISLRCKGKKGLLLSFLFSFVVSLCFETIQFLYAIGEFDVDDVMLNVAGAMAGYGLIYVIYIGKRLLAGEKGYL